MNDNPDADPNNVHPESQVDAWRELIDELRDRVRSLEEANSESRRIIAALTSMILAIEAPQEGEARVSSETATVMPMEPATSEASEGAQMGSERPQESLHEPARRPPPWWLVALLGLLLVVSVSFLSFFVVLAAG